MDASNTFLSRMLTADYDDDANQSGMRENKSRDQLISLVCFLPSQ